MSGRVVNINVNTAALKIFTGGKGKKTTKSDCGGKVTETGDRGGEVDHGIKQAKRTSSVSHGAALLEVCPAPFQLLCAASPSDTVQRSGQTQWLGDGERTATHINRRPPPYNLLGDLYARLPPHSCEFIQSDSAGKGE